MQMFGQIWNMDMQHQNVVQVTWELMWLKKNKQKNTLKQTDVLLQW